MKVFLVDDEYLNFREMRYLLQDYPGIEIAGTFTDPLAALEQFASVMPDVVFLDINMPHIDGLKLTQQMRRLNKKLLVVYTTAYSDYALDAYRTFPSDYLLKPINPNRFRKTMEHLYAQFGCIYGQSPQPVFSIKLFGGLRVFIKGREVEVRWKTKRVKELFAYLVSEYTVSLTSAEMSRAIFCEHEDAKSRNSLYVAIHALRSMLEQEPFLGNGVQLKENYRLSVPKGMCDYIQFIDFSEKNPIITQQNAEQAKQILKTYHHDFLQGENYEWMEEIIRKLDERFEQTSLNLAGFYLAGEQYGEAEEVYLYLLTVCPYSTNGYVGLLNGYRQTRNSAMLIARYEEYERMLREAYDVLPEPDLEASYQAALRAQKPVVKSTVKNADGWFTVRL